MVRIEGRDGGRRRNDRGRSDRIDALAQAAARANADRRNEEAKFARGVELNPRGRHREYGVFKGKSQGDRNSLMADSDDA